MNRIESKYKFVEPVYIGEGYYFKESQVISMYVDYTNNLKTEEELAKKYNLAPHIAKGVIEEGAVLFNN